MSTRGTIWMDDAFHLYEEAHDRTVHLEVITAGGSEISLQLPRDLVIALQRHHLPPEDDRTVEGGFMAAVLHDIELSKAKRSGRTG